MNQYCKVSAPGKVILHGEHSVVYGKSAIAASLGIRTSGSIQEHAEESYISISLKSISDTKLKFSIDDIKNNLFLKTASIPFNWFTPQDVDHPRFLAVVTNYWQSYCEKIGMVPSETLSQGTTIALYLLSAILRSPDGGCYSFDLEVSSDLSIGSGIGSSASYSVTLAAVMLLFLRTKQPIQYCSKLKLDLNEITNNKLFNETEKKLISTWAYCGEKISHGNPSGIDNTVCTYGALVEFKKEHEPTHHNLKKPLKVCLVNTNVKRNTKALVIKVSKLKGRHPEILEPLLESFEHITHKALKMIKSIDAGKHDNIYFEQLAELFTLNHDLLRALGVSHPTLETAVAVSNELGFSCKLTGAGGGGFAIVLIPNDAPNTLVQSLLEKLATSGLDGKVVYLGGEGVKIDCI